MTTFYGQDSFSFRKQALFKSAGCFDLTYETSCAGFDISGTEPLNSARRIIFSIDNKLFKFGNSGLIEYKNRGELPDILENGNTVAELLALTDVPQFVGKKVFPIIALDSPADAAVFPNIKIALKVSSFNDIYTKEIFSPIYDLADNAKIHDILSSTFTNGNASVTCYARIFNGSWSDFEFLPNFKNKSASKIQFKSNYVLSTLDGSDFAGVNFIRCLFSDNFQLLSGTSQNIITLAQDYDADLKTCYALIAHSPLSDARIKAFVSFTPKFIKREKVLLGATSGVEQSFPLAFNNVLDSNILQDSIHIEVGGIPITDFYFDTENSTVTFSADAGLPVTADYEVATAENWLEMSQDFSKFNGENFVTRFSYQLANSGNSSRLAVKFEVSKFAANVDTFCIDIFNGKLQTFALPHRAIADSLSCSGAFIYDELSHSLKTLGRIGDPILLGYSFQGTAPKIFYYIVGASII